MNERYEIAKKIAEIVSGNAWCPDQEKENAPVRVYLPKKQGFIKIENDGVNIDPVGRSAFEDVKKSLKAAGYNVYRA